jgi:hypothetical protein
MLIKRVVLAILIVPCTMASIWKESADALIAEKDTGKLEQTFQDLRKRHGDYYTSDALAEVAKQGHPEIVVTCLRTVQDPFPNDKMRVSYLVDDTLGKISLRTPVDSESFVKVITSFKSTDVKPLAVIRDVTPWRDDTESVLKGVMDKSPELITDTLPNWLASHRFDRSSLLYTQNQTAREGGFKYLASFATESVLEKALSIVKRNEHYKVDGMTGLVVACCNSQDHIPQDLVDKLTGLLALMKARNAPVKEALPLMPAVLLKLLAEYITYEAT